MPIKLGRRASVRIMAKTTMMKQVAGAKVTTTLKDSANIRAKKGSLMIEEASPTLVATVRETREGMSLTISKEAPRIVYRMISTKGDRTIRSVDGRMSPSSGREARICKAKCMSERVIKSNKIGPEAKTRGVVNGSTKARPTPTSMRRDATSKTTTNETTQITAISK